MDLYELKPGDQVRTVDGAEAEITNATEDNQWIKVLYVDSADDFAIIGTEDLCHTSELQELLGRGLAPAKPADISG